MKPTSKGDTNMSSTKKMSKADPPDGNNNLTTKNGQEKYQDNFYTAELHEERKKLYKQKKKTAKLRKPEVIEAHKAKVKEMERIYKKNIREAKHIYDELEFERKLEEMTPIL